MEKKARKKIYEKKSISKTFTLMRHVVYDKLLRSYYKNLGILACRHYIEWCQMHDYQMRKLVKEWKKNTNKRQKIRHNMCSVTCEIRHNTGAAHTRTQSEMNRINN